MTRDNNVFVDLLGSLKKLDKYGKPTSNEYGSLSCKKENCMIGIHGGMFDSYDKYFYNPNRTVYESWQTLLGDKEFIGIGWQSIPTTGHMLFKAWRLGHLTWYGLAKENARRIAPKLAEEFLKIENRFAVMCHSLGCYLLMEILKYGQIDNLSKVMLMNASLFNDDELVDFNALRNFEIYNIYTREDGLLKIASFLEKQKQESCVGLNGLKLNKSAIGVNIELKVRHQSNPYSFNLKNPNRLIHHLYVFESDYSRQVLREILGASQMLSDKNDYSLKSQEEIKKIYPIYSRK